MKARFNFSSGLNSDSDRKQQPANTLRDAVNFDLLEGGSIRALKNIKGTVEEGTIFASLNPGDYNILAAFESEGIINGMTKDCVVVFLKERSLGVLGSNRIIVYDIQGQASYTLCDDQALLFDPNGTIDGFTWTEKTKPQIIFTDGVNEIRKIDIVFSGSTYTAKELSLRPYAPVDPINYVSVGAGGQLLAGTYQIGYRYFNTDTGKYTTWSLLTNPIPVIPDDSTAVDKDTVIGGNPNTPTNKAITVSVSKTVANSTGYDAIQLVVVKNTTGASNAATVAYKLSPSIEYFNNPATIVYSGSGEETEILIEEVVIEDAPLLSAKTITQKDNRVFAGNLVYQEFTYNNGTPTFDKAYTIKQSLTADAYKNESDTVNYKGYWRDEVYRFGITYMDKFGNWSPVEPFDFSAYKWDAVDPSFNTQIIQSAVYNALTDATVITVQGTYAGQNVSKYDYVKVSTGNFQVILSSFAGAQSFLTVRGNASGVGAGTPIVKLYGHKYNNGASKDWRFPSRENHEFTILNDSDEVEAIGLRIEGVRNHPSWAKAFAIVRMPRKKNIIFQSPQIPIIAVQGIPTPGLALSDWDYGEVEGTGLAAVGYYRDSRDTCYVKKHGFGAARNIYAWTPGAFQFSQPVYATHNNSGNPENGYPNGMVLIPPDYVYNLRGEPFDTVNINTSLSIQIVDALSWQFNKKFINNAVGSLRNALVYTATSAANYFYTRDGYITFSGNNKYYTKLNTLNPFTTGTALTTTNVKNGDYYVVNSPLAITQSPLFDSNSQFKHIALFGGVSTLSTQQGEHPGVSNSPSGSIVNFGQPVENQRAMLVTTVDSILDLSYYHAYDYVVNGIDYFPLLVQKPTAEIYDNTHLTVTLSNPSQPAMDGLSLALGNSNDDDTKRGGVASVTGDIAGSAYIVNLVSTLGDDRYGSSDEEQQYIFTGVYQTLDAADIILNTPFNVDIYGGDCFVTKAAIKITNSNALPVRFNPDDASIPGAIVLDDVAKTGSYQDYVEILEFYVESEVNAGYHAQRYGYPYADTTSIDTYNQTYDYNYSPSYSRGNDPKSVFSFDLGSLEQDIFPARLIYSDQKIYQSNVFGFDRFRVNNILDLEETYGAITKLTTDNTGEVFALQERAVRYIPVNKVQTQLQDGSNQFIGASNVIGTSVNYLTRTNGCQHIRAVTSLGDYIYFADARTREIYRFPGMARPERISDAGQYNRVRDYLAGNLEEYLFQMHYDLDKKQVHIEKAGGRTLVWNERFQLWVPDIDTGSTRNLRGVYAFGDLYYIAKDGNDVKIYKMYAGDRGEFFGEYVDSSLTIIANPNIEVAKTFEVVSLNGNNRFDILDAQTFYEDTDLPNQTVTNLSITDIPHREGRYHINRLRDDSRQSVLRGTHMELSLTVQNSVDNKEVSLSEILVEFRPSLRFSQ